MLSEKGRAYDKLKFTGQIFKDAFEGDSIHINTMSSFFT